MDALRDYIGSSRIARVVERKTDRTAVEAFYASRDYAPIWVSSKGPTAIAKQAGDYLRNSDSDGMDPAEYPVPAINAGASPAELAEAEIRLTESVLDYARHASTGRVHYSRVAGDIVYCSAGYGVGAAAWRVVEKGDVLVPELLWRANNKLINHWSTPVANTGLLIEPARKRVFVSTGVLPANSVTPNPAA